MAPSGPKAWPAHPPGSPSETDKIDYLQSRGPRQQTRALAWTLGQETKNARPAPKGHLAPAEKTQRVASIAALPATEESAARCPLPRPQRCKAAFLLASVGREIPAGAEAARNHSNDTVLGELGGIPRPRPPTCSVLFPKLGAVLSPWVLGIWVLTACPLTARCSSFARLLAVGWDPHGAEVMGVGGA